MGSIACSDIHEACSPAAVAGQEPSFRVEKVLDIKRQLAEGRYDIAEKLDVVVDRLLEDLLVAHP
jgi:anti-sigma28 factor (negative regulator of flagellin synthesis)